MTSFQQQKQRKVLDKEAEELEALGGENEKQAIKDTQRIYKEKEKQQQSEKDQLMELIMGASKGNKFSYHQFLAHLVEKRLTAVDFPLGWLYQVFPDKTGVVIELVSPAPEKKYFRKAFKPCGEAVYDLNAIDRYGQMAENTVESLQPRDNLCKKTTSKPKTN